MLVLGLKIAKINPQKLFIWFQSEKSDLADRRAVNTEEGQELVDKQGIQFYETSAKTGENVNSIFINSADEIAKKIDQNYYDLENDSCGIKQGINRHNNNAQVRLDNRGGQKKVVEEVIVNY